MKIIFWMGCGLVELNQGAVGKQKMFWPAWFVLGVRIDKPYTVRKNPSYYRNNWYPKCTSDTDPSVTGLGTLV